MYCNIHIKFITITWQSIGLIIGKLILDLSRFSATEKGLEGINDLGVQRKEVPDQDNLKIADKCRKNKAGEVSFLFQLDLLSITQSYILFRAALTL